MLLSIFEVFFLQIVFVFVLFLLSKLRELLEANELARVGNARTAIDHCLAGIQEQRTGGVLTREYAELKQHIASQSQCAKFLLIDRIG